VTTHVERSIEVEVPVRMAYDQWSRFEEFPRFMSGVEEVRRVGDGMTHWVAHISGVRREWDAAIVEQVPDEKVAWAATTGATNAGAVFFDAVATDCTRVRLTLDFEPEGVIERIGDVMDVVQRQAVADLDRFKEFIEGQSSVAGGWRGTSEDGGVMSQEAQGQAVRQAAADDLPGDVVAVGPTGDTESTLTTDAETTPSSAPEADYSAVGHSGDPVAVDPEALGATTGTDEAWSSGGSGPGEDRDVRDTAGEGVVERDFADENLTTEDVVARDFANRDISGEGVVERDFANRDITERDIAHRGIDPESAGAPISEPTDAHGGINPESTGAPISEPTSLDAADDPDNPVRRSV
jgi:carbon monoxide dehydrogenase subunit G